MPNEPTPAAAPASAPSTSSAPAPLSNDGVNSVDDIFADFSRSVGLDPASQGNSLENSKKYEERSVQDLYDDLDSKPEEGKDGEPSTDATQQTDTNNTDQIVADASKPFEYEFKTTIGDQETAINFKSKEQLDAALKKAVVADKIYDRYKKQGEELKTYKASHEFAQRFDELMEKSPTAILDSILEDMSEADQSKYLIAKAEYLSIDPRQREFDKRMKEAEATKAQLAHITAEQERLQQQRVKASQEADNHVVQSWGEGLMAKAQARF